MTRAMFVAMISALVFALGAASCGPQDPERVPPEDPTEEVAPDRPDAPPQDGPDAPAVGLVDGKLANGFGLALLAKLAGSGKDRVLVSPQGVGSALLLAWNGAGGETRSAIGRTLGLAPGSDPEGVNAAWSAKRVALSRTGSGVKLTSANSVWAREGFPLRPDFIERARGSFGAAVEPIDFDAADAPGRINRWVSEGTGGKIDEIVPDPIPRGVALYVINALYFKGQWARPFDTSATRPGAFHPAHGTPTRVPMMTRHGKWRHAERDGARALRLPYGEDRFAMYVVLPPEKGGLDAWLADLDADVWEALVASMRVGDANVVLPRFRFDYGANLKQVLAALGMGAAFAEDADFGALTPKQVAITDVVHKTFIEVDEEGTEAGAATSVEIGVTSAGPPPFEFVVDRPFFFAIRDDESGALIFTGIVRALP